MLKLLRNFCHTFIFSTLIIYFSEVWPRQILDLGKQFNLMIHLENVLKRSLQDVLKMSWRHLEDVLKISSEHLEDILKMSSERLEDVLKMSCARRLEDVFKNVLKTSWQDVLKTSWRRLENVLKASWRRKSQATIFVLIKTSWRRLLKTKTKDVFIKTNVC